MFIKKYGDICVSIVFMLISIAVLVAAAQLPASKVMEIGPDFMPKVIGGLTLVLSILLLVFSINSLKRNPDAVYVADDANYKRVLISFILILIYVCVFKPVGFIISTLVYLPCQMFVLAPEEKRTKAEIIKLAIIDVIFTLAVFFLFRYGFKIVLPAGIFTINL